MVSKPSGDPENNPKKMRKKVLTNEGGFDMIINAADKKATNA
jgi:hypothetical protein